MNKLEKHIYDHIKLFHKETGQQDIKIGWVNENQTTHFIHIGEQGMVDGYFKSYNIRKIDCETPFNFRYEADFVIKSEVSK